MNGSRILLVAGLLAILPSIARAQENGDAPAEPGEAWAFKLTPSWYTTSHEADARDLNLRANRGPHALWLGYYRRNGEFDQARTGYEYTLETPWGTWVPSLQVASHGFAGASLSGQIGGPVFVLVGLGRTNSRDYYNLNFDPNDSLLYGAGTTLLPQSTLSLFSVRDNRLDTGQVITHLNWRLWPDARQRWTLDFSRKHGRASPDAEQVAGTGLSVTYDYRDVFIRVVGDRKVNFSSDDQTRFSLGLRF